MVEGSSSDILKGHSALTAHEHLFDGQFAVGSTSQAAVSRESERCCTESAPAVPTSATVVSSHARAPVGHSDLDGTRQPTDFNGAHARLNWAAPQPGSTSLVSTSPMSAAMSQHTWAVPQQGTQPVQSPALALDRILTPPCSEQQQTCSRTAQSAGPFLQCEQSSRPMSHFGAQMLDLPFEWDPSEVTWPQAQPGLCVQSSDACLSNQLHSSFSMDPPSTCGVARFSPVQQGPPPALRRKADSVGLQRAPSWQTASPAFTSSPSSHLNLYAHLDLSRPLCLQQPSAFAFSGGSEFGPRPGSPWLLDPDWQQQEQQQSAAYQQQKQAAHQQQQAAHQQQQATYQQRASAYRQQPCPSQQQQQHLTEGEFLRDASTNPSLSNSNLGMLFYKDLMLHMSLGRSTRMCTIRVVRSKLYLITFDASHSLTILVSTYGSTEACMQCACIGTEM